MEKKDGKRPGSMVAPQARLQLVEELATERGVPAHALAGMRRHYGWAEGKSLTAAEFEGAMEGYRDKPLGGGR